MILDAALTYAGLGLRVVPLHTPVRQDPFDATSPLVCSCGRPDCKAIGKHPRITEWQHKASSDPEQIRRWWQTWPAANVGIAGTSDLAILDIDPGHGGEETLEQLQDEHGRLPDTWEAITGSGGRHLFFRAAGALPNAVGIAGLGGLDLRSQGGFVVAAPSLHASGRRYLWEASSDPSDGVSLAPMPGWLEALVSRPRGSSQPSKLGDQVIEGERDNTLFRAALRWHKQGLPAGEILAVAQMLNQTRCKPPLLESEVKRLVASAVRYEGPNPAIASAECPDLDASEPSVADAPESQTTNPVEHDPLSDEAIAEDQARRAETVARLLAAGVPEPIRWSALRAQPAREYLVDGLFASTEGILLAAKQKSGKTFVVIDSILAMTHGWYVFAKFKCARPLRVVYCTTEGRRGLPNRFMAAIQANPDFDYETFERNFLHIPALPQLYDCEVGMQPSQLCSMLDAKGFVPDVLILDTWNKSTLGAEENSARDVAFCCHRLAEMREQLGCCSWIVHHSSKEGSSVRGSTALEADVDLLLQLVYDESEDHRAISYGYAKDTPPFQDLAFKLRGVPPPVDSAAVEWTAAPARQERKREPLTVDLLLRAAMHVEHLVSEWWTFSQLLTQLKAMGEVRWSNEYIGKKLYDNSGMPGGGFPFIVEKNGPAGRMVYQRDPNYKEGSPAGSNAKKEGS